MKKIFPVITILILFSLLGLIFFQFLWIKGALESQEQKFNDNLVQATYEVSEDLVREKGNLMPLTKKNKSIFPSERLQMEFFAPTIAQKFTKDEIKLALENNFIPVSLGETRLRTETAGIVAASLLRQV